MANLSPSNKAQDVLARGPVKPSKKDPRPVPVDNPGIKPEAPKHTVGIDWDIT